jgi:DNA (cytosine-5)-methyltransferase 1
MAVCYNRLWHILVDKHWSKTKLRKEAKISTNAMARMSKGQDVRVETLVKICGVLNCTIDDIMEIIPDDK